MRGAPNVPVPFLVRTYLPRAIPASMVASGISIRIVPLNAHYSLSREIVQNNNYPIQKWNQPHESYIARAPKEVLERAMVGNGKPTDHTNHSGSHHSTIACIIGKGPPPCWPN